MDLIKFKKVKIKKYKFKKKSKRPKRKIKIKTIIYLIGLIFSFYLFLLIGAQLSRYIIKKNPQRKNRKNNNKKLNITNFTTYSLGSEDFVLYCIFYDIDNGFYIDVGANDPNKISDTKAFYLKGWHGINIEPLPDMFKLLLKYRSRDINLNIGAGEKEGVMPLKVDGFGSTFNKKYFGNNRATIDIKIYPMSEICKKYVPKDEDIQFCKIDVEGYEKNVLLGYDFTNYRPKVFCIESTAPFRPDISTHQEWEYILLQNGYAFGFQLSINRFYYDTKVDYIGKRFLNLDKYVNEYKEIQQRKKRKI